MGLRENTPDGCLAPQRVGQHLEGDVPLIAAEAQLAEGRQRQGVSGVVRQVESALQCQILSGRVPKPNPS